MRSFLAFFKKELLECLRRGRLLFLGLLFAGFGLMNPAIAKLTPLLMDLLAEELDASGIVMEAIAADALASWVQFFKNIPMALIAFVLICGGTFTKEYGSGTLILVLTKGLSRYKVVLAKSALLLGLWTAGYWLCFGITYGCNAILWDNGTVPNLLFAVVSWWMFGVLTVALTVLFSVLFRSYGLVLLGTGGSILVLYLLELLLSLWPDLANKTPAALMNSGALLAGATSAEAYGLALVLAAVCGAVCVGVSIPILNKKQL